MDNNKYSNQIRHLQDMEKDFELANDIGKYLSLFYRRLMMNIGSDLKKISMTPLQSIALMNIFRHEGVNQNELAAIASVDKASLSRVIRNLEDQGYVWKETDESDRRYFKLYLTDVGFDELEKSIEIQREAWNQCMWNISKQEQLILRDALVKLCDNVYGNIDKL